MRTEIDREAVCQGFRRNRRRSDAIFQMLDHRAYYERPIAQRHPFCFYEGHLPAFNVNTLLKRALGQPGVDGELERLFERGIDPERAAIDGGDIAWPPRSVVREFADEADRRVLDALANAQLTDERNPLLERGLAVFTILEHELMHHETLLYMAHRLDFAMKRRPANAAQPSRGGPAPVRERVTIPRGIATLGVDAGEVAFAWDNELSRNTVDVAEFAIDVHDVTNADYLEFVEAGGYRRAEFWTEDGWMWRSEAHVDHPLFWERGGGALDPDRWMWRGMFDSFELPLSWPVYVSHAEATAFARWKGARLPSEAEFHRAAFATPSGGERAHPWGDSAPDATRGNFDFASFDPTPVGSHAAGASAWGVHDLVGNGWEWTSTLFAPFAGFHAMPTYPQYSADFFDGQHWVLKGASPATGVKLVRRSLRNWFRPNYPYVYATFRCAR